MVLTKSDVGLSNVNNTSDINKPISNATNNALANKVDKVTGKGLSTEDFTTADKTKLTGIESGAQVNVVNSVASKTGNVILVKGDVGLGNVDNTPDLNKPTSTEVQGKLDNKVDKVSGKQLSDENYTSAEKTKLAGIETGAEVNTVTSVAGKTGSVIVTKSDVGLGNVGNGLQLYQSNNLSDLTNVSTARNNLNLGNNAVTNYYISTGNPTGGVNGDVWYKI